MPYLTTSTTIIIHTFPSLFSPAISFDIVTVCVKLRKKMSTKFPAAGKQKILIDHKFGRGKNLKDKKVNIKQNLKKKFYQCKPNPFT